MTGQKFSEGKLPIGKVILKQFPRAFKEVVRNSNTGHQKYILSDQNWDNWKHVKGGKDTYIDAALRHLIQAENEVWDKETEPYGGSRHLAAVAWNILAALELDLMEEEKLERGWKNLEGQGFEKPVKINDNPLLNIGENPTKIPYKNSVGNPWYSTIGYSTSPDINKTVVMEIEKTAKENGTTWLEEAEKGINKWYSYGQNPYHNNTEIPRLSVDELFQQNQKITPIPMQLPIEQEALKVVEDLNNESWIDIPASRYNDILCFNPFKCEFDGYYYSINFMNICIWDSDNDGRNYDENNEGYGEEKIPLRDYIIKESKKITKHLKRRMKILR